MPAGSASVPDRNLVTTLDLAVEQIVELYGLPWNIELDLRSLKETVHLHSLRALTPDMAERNWCWPRRPTTSYGRRSARPLGRPRWTRGKSASPGRRMLSTRVCPISTRQHIPKARTGQPYA
jgi:hypothetical protein